MTDQHVPRADAEDRRQAGVPTVWICSYLPQARGAGVERFAEMIAGIVRRSGWSARVLDLASVVSEGSRLPKLRYVVAWRIGRKVNRLAGPKDVIVCNNFFSWNARRDRSMVVFHGTDIGRATKNRKNMPLLRNLAVRVVDSRLEKRTGMRRLVVAVSQTAKEEIEEYYGYKVQKVIPNAVDLSLFSPGADKSKLRDKFGLPLDKFLILFVGTPDPRKGLGWILRELKPRLGENQHLVLRTDLPDAPTDVTVVKRLPIEQLADLYRACDVLLFPTSYEGCSFSLVEALASGLPVITSPAGSGRDLLGNDALSPYIVHGNDVGKYLDRINRLESSKGERAKVSAAARAFAVEHHGLADFEREYLKLIRELAS